MGASGRKRHDQCPGDGVEMTSLIQMKKSDVSLKGIQASSEFTARKAANMAVQKNFPLARF